MFKNIKDEKVSPELLNSSNNIGKGTTFTGNIETFGNIRIEGKIVGDLISKSKVIVGQSAEIEGNIIGQFIDVEGTVNGTLKASDQLSLKSTCKINGDVEAGKLVVEAGAVFNGKCKMGKVTPINKLENQPEQKPRPAVSNG